MNYELCMPKNSPELSIIVPTYDEANTAPCLLEDLREQRDIHLEVIVIDGGSIDGTVERVQGLADRVLVGERGRGRQMNEGAREAHAETLLFLHADSRIPQRDLLRRALDALEDEIAAAGHSRVAGHFALLFRGPDREGGFGYRYLERKTELNRKNTTNGDQGLLLRKAFFVELGGFDTRLSFLEDQRIAETIRRRGVWFTLPGRVITSTRRFAAEGFDRRYILMSIIMGCFDAGIDNFFEHAERAYAPQSEAERLDMKPVFEAIETTLAERGTWGRVKAWWDVGRFIRQNAWQLFFVWDVVLEDEFDAQTPCLDFYDRQVEPRLDGPFFDALTAVLSAHTFTVVFPAYYWCVDRGIPAFRRWRDERLSGRRRNL